MEDKEKTSTVSVIPNRSLPSKKRSNSEIETSNEGVSARMLIRDTINGYVFWSIFQGLTPMIWFYPLNDLEISGYEAFAAFWLLPVICIIPGVFTLISNRWILGILRMITVASVVSFQAPTTLSRLIILAVGAGVSMLVLTATLFSPSGRIRCHTYWGLMLGLSTFVTSRIWLGSFVPAWWNNTTNSAVVTVGFIAVFDGFVSGDDIVEKPTNTLSKADRPYWILCSLGFGSLMFLTHWCFGEVSLITRWVVKGYPNHGPLPNIWGGPVLLALIFGIFLSEVRDVGRSFIWWLVGLGAFAGLYYLPTWEGYIAGLVLAIYSMSVWPTMVNQMSACPSACTLALANLVYIAEMLFLVWTVAYNFVPGGVYTREHTDWLIAAVMAFILMGLKSGGKVPNNFTAFVTYEKKKMPTGVHRAMLLFLVVTGLIGFGYRADLHKHILQKQSNPRDFTAMIWAYHFGYDNKGWPSLERSASLMLDAGADVITLLESDASKPFLGNNDLGMWLGQRLNMHVDFGPSTRDHTWGNLLLSRFPIIKSVHHLLPSPHGELAPAITATINISGQAVDFVVSHMGNDRDVLDRQLQAQFLAEELKKSKNPAVFLGYVTSLPGSRDYWQLIKEGGVKDIDETDKKRWCEYIMYKDLIRLGYARITHGGLSDTEIQLGRFRIPDNPSYIDGSKIVTDPTQVNSSIHFNPKFGKFYAGHGHFSHHGFHMSTPKYFLP